MKRLNWIWLVLFFAALCCVWGALARCQTIDSSVHVNQFKGTTVGAKVANAMLTCTMAPASPCILVIDPSLAPMATGTMPSLCTNCYLADYRNGPAGPGSIAGQPILPSSVANSQLQGKRVTALGDSISADCPDLSGGKCWVDQLAAYYSFAPSPHGNNLAVPGSTSTGVWHQEIGNSSARAGSVTTLLDGQNDGCSSYVFEALNGTRLETGWLGVMEATAYDALLLNKTLASGMTASGTWTTSAYYTGGLATTQNGATLTFTSIGPTVLVNLTTFLPYTTGSSPAITVTIDGTNAGTFPATSQQPGSTDLYPYNGWLIRIPNQTRGAHTVVVTAVINNASFPLYVNWGSGNMQQGGLDSEGTLFWAYPYASTVQTESTTLPGCRDQINLGVGDLQADGLRANRVDLTAACYAPNSITPLCNQHDGTHPDAAGTAIIAKQFEEAGDRLAYPIIPIPSSDLPLPATTGTGDAVMQNSPTINNPTIESPIIELGGSSSYIQVDANSVIFPNGGSIIATGIAGFATLPATCDPGFIGIVNSTGIPNYCNPADVWTPFSFGAAPVAWSQTTPTVTSSSGTITTASSVVRVGTAGKSNSFNVDVLITTVGTASGTAKLTMPFTAESSSYTYCFEHAVAGVPGTLYMTAGSAIANLSSPGNIFSGNGADWNCTGTFESQ